MKRSYIEQYLENSWEEDTRVDAIIAWHKDEYIELPDIISIVWAGFDEAPCKLYLEEERVIILDMTKQPELTRYLLSELRSDAGCMAPSWAASARPYH